MGRATSDVIGRKMVGGVSTTFGRRTLSRSVAVVTLPSRFSTHATLFPIILKAFPHSAGVMPASLIALHPPLWAAPLPCHRSTHGPLQLLICETALELFCNLQRVGRVDGTVGGRTLCSPAVVSKQQTANFINKWSASLPSSLSPFPLFTHRLSLLFLSRLV